MARPEHKLHQKRIEQSTVIPAQAIIEACIGLFGQPQVTQKIPDGMTRLLKRKVLIPIRLEPRALYIPADYIDGYHWQAHNEQNPTHMKFTGLFPDSRLADATTIITITQNGDPYNTRRHMLIAVYPDSTNEIYYFQSRDPLVSVVDPKLVPVTSSEDARVLFHAIPGKPGSEQSVQLMMWRQDTLTQDHVLVSGFFTQTALFEAMHILEPHT